MSASRLARLQAELTPSDLAVLGFIAAVRYATGTQLARRLWDSTNPSGSAARTARRTLARLEEQRIIGRLGRRLGGVRGGSSSVVYRLESAGYRLLGCSGKRGRSPSTYGAVRHAIAVTELVVQLHERAELAGLAVALETEPRCWRSFLGVLGQEVVLKPDLFMAIDGAHHDRWFIEVDLNTESPARIRTKAQRYLDHFQTGDEQHHHQVYPRIVWTAPDADRLSTLRRTLHDLDPLASRLFVVWRFDETVGRLIAEANS